MRKKTKQSVDVAAVADAWQAFFDNNRVDEDAELRKAGWLDIYTIAKKINRAPVTINAGPERFGLESKVFKVYRSGKVRQVTYCRPK